MAKKILIIDDDPDVILFLSTLLRDQGFEPCEAQNGAEGYEKAKAEKPDLILLDLMMPEKSGIAFLQDLRMDDGLKTTPVIMVTGVSGETGIDLETFFERNRAKGSEGEAPRPEAYIEKPVDPDRLLSLIREILD